MPPVLCGSRACLPWLAAHAEQSRRGRAPPTAPSRAMTPQEPRRPPIPAARDRAPGGERRVGLAPHDRLRRAAALVARPARARCDGRAGDSGAHRPRATTHRGHSTRGALRIVARAVCPAC
eukprot:1859609-Prymnesium_polylepis.2